MAIELVAIIVTVGLAISAGLIAWGKLNRTVENHSKSIEGCKMDNLVTDDDCEKSRDHCADRLDLILANMTEKFDALKENVKEDMQELKTDAKAAREAHSDYREQTAGSLRRIEVKLGLLTNGLKK